MESTSKQSKQKAPAKAERLIYCGPNLPGGLLQRNVIFKGGISPHLKAVTSKCPEIKALFVKPEDLSRVNTALGQQGSLENLRYQAVMDFINKGGLQRGL
ncbi:hypothetical protein [Anaerospora sp.]|uniref:hypothetical protein n=1 Tax=Anaerospora sp. TaxID=1960278 RepID=UPI002898C070|nr:hypothetical protein [Anaerospora sp.]